MTIPYLHIGDILTVIGFIAAGGGWAYKVIIKRIESKIITKADLDDLAKKLPINGNRFLVVEDLGKICPVNHKIMEEHIANDFKRLNVLNDKLGTMAEGIARIEGRLGSK